MSVQLPDNYFKRDLKIDLPIGQSAFLWGARKTGKSTFLEHQFPDAVFFDLLQNDLYWELLKNPEYFREKILALIPKDPKQARPLIIVDEIQKVPPLLDEVHHLIEKHHCQFILCGSSARKLKQQGANLLGGRAWKYNFFPLTSQELPELDLLKIFNCGTIPQHWLSIQPLKHLRAYIEDYLAHEIQAEGLVRNLPIFARFLDSLRFSNGELIQYQNIARDCHIDSKTVKAYFEILVDTLLGYFLPPFQKKVRRDIISATPKFYLFDVGVSTFLKKFNFLDLKGPEAGQALEHFVFLELIAYKHYSDKFFEIHFWRTSQGLEVDFILAEGLVALEVKINRQVHFNELKGLIAFQEEHKPRTSILVCLEKAPRLVETEYGEVLIEPLASFLKRLWAGEII
ncbi:MAG: ATP-binding protein [Gammaproteobacteria bacterium]